MSFNKRLLCCFSAVSTSLLFFSGFVLGDTINTCTNFLPCEVNPINYFMVGLFFVLTILSWYYWIKEELKDVM